MECKKCNNEEVTEFYYFKGEQYCDGCAHRYIDPVTLQYGLATGEIKKKATGREFRGFSEGARRVWDKRNRF